MKKFLFSALSTVVLSLLMTSAQAHSPLFDCFDNGDDTITCEAGFSDGGSAIGIAVRVLDAQGKVLEQGFIGRENNIVFALPDEEYSVVFNAGEGHSIAVYGDDIY